MRYNKIRNLPEKLETMKLSGEHVGLKHSLRFKVGASVTAVVKNKFNLQNVSVYLAIIQAKL